MSAAPKLKEQSKFHIEVTKGPHQGLKLSFNKPSVLIGRGPENDIVLANDPKTSRQHAEIKLHGSDFVILNLSTKNFVSLNGQTVQSEILNSGSVLTIGESEIQFFPDKELPKSEVSANPQPSPPARVSPVLTPVSSTSVPAMTQSQSPIYTPPRPTAVPQHQSIPIYQSPPASTGSAGGGGGYRPHSKPASPSPASGGGLSNPRVRFYGIVVVLGLVGWWLLSPNKNKSDKDPNAIRTAPMSMQDVAQAEKRSQDLQSNKKEKYDSIQGRRAQENFVKGFRDFQQGQYARARESFQVVLNLDPENELAKRYYHLSKIKFDELVKFNMIQGNRYREKRNWRMCQSNYSNVLTMLQTRKDDPTYKEAKQYFEECSLNSEGRF